MADPAGLPARGASGVVELTSAGGDAGDGEVDPDPPGATPRVPTIGG